ncbi:MAG TPA: nicotinamide-nucleotide amidohydrolase family protein [Nocardioidaceae bacterium]|jgi:nicotinamide-nucleotide amidase
MTDPGSEVAEACLRALHHRSATLATAESLTAGLVVSTLATIPGASDVLRGGLAAYATEVKVDVLGVDSEVIARVGVISAECAEQMALAARDLFRADWAVATTGVAGPDSQDGHPPGEVYVAVAGPENLVSSQRLMLTGDRQQIRSASVDGVLELLLTALEHTDRRGP